MRRRLSRLCFAIVIFIIIYLIVLRFDSVITDKSNASENLSLPTKGAENPTTEKPQVTSSEPMEIILAVVVCGDRLRETLTMLKSAILFAPPAFLRITIITEPKLMGDFNEKLAEWREIANKSFTFETHQVKFPTSQGNEWRDLFKPCASQRLFLPSLLPHIDSVLYVDTDVLFLSPLSQVWQHFKLMNSTQLAALTPEHEDPNTGWYNRFARHPYYGQLGVNSGVMLMNLTRMRAFHWESYLLPILKEYKLKITWGDQDIINIIFHYHPERLYVYDCRYNYRPDHCIYMSVCRPADKNGVRIVHGSRGTFHNERQPTFRALYTAMQEYQLGLDPYQYLVLPLESFLDNASENNCGRDNTIFTKEMKQHIKEKDFYR